MLTPLSRGDTELVRLLEITRALVTAIANAGRLHALAVVGARRFREKSAQAELAYHYLSRAYRMESFVEVFLQEKPLPLAWGTLSPEERGVLSCGKLDEEALARLTTKLIHDIAAGLCLLRKSTEGHPLLCPVSLLIEELDVLAVAAAEDAAFPVQEYTSAKTSPEKVIGGPLKVPLDPAFRPAYSLAERNVPGFSNSPKQAAAHYWCTAVREANAADLCALCVIEYDGLPLAFYVDFVKQTWDEVRHAEFFLAVGKRLLRETGDDSTSSDLPIPRERGLYEAMLNATLSERLVLMHLDTETPGIKTFSSEIESELCRHRPEIAAGLSVIRRDEISHSRIGKRWLEFLLPDRSRREEEVENARLLRGFLLLTSFAVHGTESLGVLAERLASATDPQRALSLMFSAAPARTTS